MKKLGGMMLIAAMSAALAACGSSKETSGTGSSASPAAASASPSQAATASPSPSAAATVSPSASTTPAATTATATPQPSASVKPADSVKPTTAPATSTKPAETASANAAIDAATVFKNTCIGCHGVDLEGKTGPNLQKVGGKLTEEQIAKQITNGGGKMPGFQNKLKDEEIKALATWLAAKK